MSDSSPPPPVPPEPPPQDVPASPIAPAKRDGCLTALMVAGGVVLLLPGICFLAFGSQAAPFALIGLVLIGLAIFLFIRAAGPAAPGPPAPPQ